MPRKSNTAKWETVKNPLSRCERKDLLNLIRDLYNRSDENSRFIQARFISASTQLESYKKIIYHALYPDIIHNEYVNFRVGRKAISDYKKATGDSVGTLKLMIYYVEQGHQFTLDYGDMDEHFYSSLESMFDATLKNLKKSDQRIIDMFLPRMQAIVNKANGMGWGYYDYIAESLAEAFPEGRMLGNA